MITKSEFKIFEELEEKIEKESMRLFKWYTENIEPLIKYKSFVYQDIENDYIFFEGGVFELEIEKVPLKLLFMTNKELNEYKAEHDKQIKIQREESAKRIQKQIENEAIQDTIQRREMYEKLKKEFG